jgi:hypothetical protein
MFKQPYTAVLMTGIFLSFTIHALFDGRPIAALIYGVLFGVLLVVGLLKTRAVDKDLNELAEANYQRDLLVKIAVKRTNEAAHTLQALLSIRELAHAGRYDEVVSLVHDTLAEWNDTDLALSYLREWLLTLEAGGVIRPIAKKEA